MAGDEKPRGKRLTAKHIVDTSSNCVIFAEAGKDVVDFLFGLLQIPLASLIRAAPSCFPGSTGNVYESLNTLDSSFINPTQDKDSLLNPRTASPAAAWLLGPNGPLAATQVKYFICTQFVNDSPSSGSRFGTPKRNCNGRFISSAYGHLCPHCGSSMTVEMQLAGPNIVDQNDGGGYVNELVNYMVMDDLRITPMPAISSVVSLLLLHEIQVQDLGLLQKREVSIGIIEGFELLKVSMHSKTVLTDVFLKKNMA